MAKTKPKNLDLLAAKLQEEIRYTWVMCFGDTRYPYTKGIRYTLKEMNSIFGTKYETSEYMIRRHFPRKSKKPLLDYSLE